MSDGIAIETVLMNINRTKDGWALTLRIHPNDINMDILNLQPGQRLGVALVKIADDDGEFVNRQEIAARVADQKLEEAAKRRFTMLLNSIVSSPYALLWAEDQSIEDPDDFLIRRHIEEKTNADTARARVKKLEAIAEEVRKYGLGQT